MRGYSDQWKDFPDYIIGITKEIWEDRGVGPKIRDYYGKDVIVRMPGGISTGVENTVASTAATLHEFPDRQLLGEDVIWSGTPEEGMLSSHRILSTATHLGSGVFGKATGKAITYRGIADCYAKDNMITDEWLVWDMAPFCARLDRILAIGCNQSGRRCTRLYARSRYLRTLPWKRHDDAWGVALGEILSSMMQSEFSVVTSQYDRACHLEYAGGISSHGRGGRCVLVALVSILSKCRISH